MNDTNMYIEDKVNTLMNKNKENNIDVKSEVLKTKRKINNSEFELKLIFNLNEFQITLQPGVT